jgi:hypothetical protein
VLQECCRSVTRALQERYKSVTRVLQVLQTCVYKLASISPVSIALSTCGLCRELRLRFLPRDGGVAGVRGRPGEERRREVNRGGREREKGHKVTR